MGTTRQSRPNFTVRLVLASPSSVLLLVLLFLCLMMMMIIVIITSSIIDTESNICKGEQTAQASSRLSGSGWGSLKSTSVPLQRRLVKERGEMYARPQPHPTRAHTYPHGTPPHPHIPASPHLYTHPCAPASQTSPTMETAAKIDLLFGGTSI